MERVYDYRRLSTIAEYRLYYPDEVLDSLPKTAFYAFECVGVCKYTKSTRNSVACELP